MDLSPVMFGNLAFLKAAWMTWAVSLFTVSGRKGQRCQIAISPGCKAGSCARD